MFGLKENFIGFEVQIKTNQKKLKQIPTEEKILQLREYC